MRSQRIVVNGILGHNDRVLIAKRSMTKKIAPGKNHLPGGHVRFGETPEEAIVREFSEEFGITVKAGRVIQTFMYVIGDMHTVGICFLLSFNGDTSAIKVDPRDNDEVVWITEDDLDKYFDPSDHNYSLLKRYFAILSA